MAEDYVTCPECLASIPVAFKSTFLGFKKRLCPKCNKSSVYELRPSYRIIYWVLLVVFVGSAVKIVAAGDVPLPSLLGLATIWALVADYKKRKDLRAQRRRQMPTDVWT